MFFIQFSERFKPRYQNVIEFSFPIMKQFCNLTIILCFKFFEPDHKIS